MERKKERKEGRKKKTDTKDGRREGANDELAPIRQREIEREREGPEVQVREGNAFFPRSIRILSIGGIPEWQKMSLGGGRENPRVLGVKSEWWCM